MDYQSWVDGINGSASLYEFDILPDGSYSEIRLMAVNQRSVGMLYMRPDAPEFYPGIPYRSFWMDLNFEKFVYESAATNKPLYSYVNARGVWLKGFYIPVYAAEKDCGDVDHKETGDRDEHSEHTEQEKKTVHCLYIIDYSNEVQTDSIAKKSTEVANAVMDISIKLHGTQDFYQAMAKTAGEIREFCGAEKCSLYTVDKNKKECVFINENGRQDEYLEQFAREMSRTPFEVAEAWEKDLALSDCLLLEDLKVIEERDPVWYGSLVSHEIRNIILYVVRYQQELVGFIWAANYDTEKMMKIKETLELSSFLIAAVISNHQLVSQLEIKSTVDRLTQVSNRNAMNERMDRYISGEEKMPEAMGVVFADLNGLKIVNDDEGHDAGDRLLERAAALLKIAFGDQEIYRAGGDEFVVICPNIEEEKMNEQVSQLRGLSNNTNDVSFAVGTAYCTGKYSILKAVQIADENMYKDKTEYYRNNPEKDRRRQGKSAE